MEGKNLSKDIITHAGEKNQYNIDTKIDWASFVYHIQDEDPERCWFNQEKLLKDILEKLNLDISEVKSNLMRDTEKSIAVISGKKTLRVEFEGSFFKLGKNNFTVLKNEFEKLNSLINTDEVWSLSRLDVAKTVSDMTVEQLLPNPEEFFYDFKYHRVDFKHSSGVLETVQLFTSKIEFVFYRKDIQMKRLSKDLSEKKTTEKHYRDKPHTRAEVRFKSGSDTLKIAVELLLKKEMSEFDFCNALLKDGTKRRNVKNINNNNKQKSIWTIEERWLSLFKQSDTRLKVNPEILKLITCPESPDIKNRELNRFKKFLERNDYSCEEAVALIQGSFVAKSSSEAKKDP